MALRIIRPTTPTRGLHRGLVSDRTGRLAQQHQPDPAHLSCGTDLAWPHGAPRARPILGMAGYIQITNQLRQAAAADDPYADWAMCQLEAKLARAKARIGE